MPNAAITDAIQEISPGALIEMFQLELNVAQHGVSEIYYFHDGTGFNNNNDLVWNNQVYTAFPIEAEGFEYNGQGSLPRPKLRISNLLGTITALLLTLPEGLEGAKVTRVRTLARFLDAANFAPTEWLLTEDNELLLYEDLTNIYQEIDPPGGTTPDPTAEFPLEIFFIDRKTAENRDVVEFELASAFDLANSRAPKRQCIQLCQWRYRSVECGYSGTSYFDFNNLPVGSLSLDVCGKRIDSCKARFGQYAELPHGGFVGIGTYYG